MLMPRGNGDDKLIKMTGEPRHWIVYGVFAFVIITAVPSRHGGLVHAEGVAKHRR
jgi:hypothetical protein